jgi:hypothetical protein
MLRYQQVRSSSPLAVAAQLEIWIASNECHETEKFPGPMSDINGLNHLAYHPSPHEARIVEV